MRKIILIMILVFFGSKAAMAQWLLNFGSASTLQPGKVAFISGTGAQLTFIQNPSSTNFTPFLAHAGIRVGLFQGVDIGYRLCTVPLPYSSAGPSLGAATDVKIRLTPVGSEFQFSMIAGGGLAYVTLSGKSKTAWSPGGAVVLSRNISATTSLTLNGRYTESYIVTAIGGGHMNYARSIGGSLGLTHDISQILAISPEIGLFDLQGKLANVPTNGLGVQIGTVLKVNLNKALQKPKN
ncbi:MAG: hypothetical protein JST50_16795 [Bacteroidetes bacterium]|jgi:hypothetical protein|nr:hypothetical protein [Bacteroidota bacterium]